MEIIKVKEWFEAQEQNKAKSYNIWLNVAERNEDGTIKNDDGYISLIGDVLKETEKAKQIHFESGEVDGSFKGWTCWVPKSVIA